MDAFTLVARLTLNRSEFDQSFKDIETDINSDSKKSTFSAWGVAVGNLAARAFSKAFSAASGFAKSIIMTGMDFDSMMSEVKAVGKMTEEQFEKLVGILVDRVIVSKEQVIICINLTNEANDPPLEQIRIGGTCLSAPSPYAYISLGWLMIAA